MDWEVLEKEQNDMFAQMKNFVGRCNNLFEICECISQFMVKTYPRFGGASGEEVKKNLIQISGEFKHQLLLVKKKKDTILDTHATNWHDDFDKFRNAIKDMEKKVCNIVDSSFMTQKSVRECLYLINNFFLIAKRKTIKDHLRTKVYDKIYTLATND